MPERFSANAAPRPAGPPPTMATSAERRSAAHGADRERGRETTRRQRRELGTTIEALATPHARAGAPLETTEVARRQRPRQSRLDRPGRGLQSPSAASEFAPLYFGIESCLRTVRHRLPQLGEWRRPGVDRVLAGHQQAAETGGR